MAGVKFNRRSVFACFLLAFACFFVYFVYFNAKKKELPIDDYGKDKKSVVCGDDIINEVNSMVTKTNVDKEIKDIIAKIKKKEGYSRDANCINAIFSLAITNHSLMPIDEQRSLFLEYTNNHNNVSKKFDTIISLEEAKLFLAE